MRFITTTLTLLGFACALLLPAAAPAQDPAPTDPSQGSPSGTIYEIPIDQGRRDGAPRTGRGGGSGSDGGSTSGGSGTDTGTTSPIRSDNGFGTSSVVPGASESGGDGAESRGSGKSRSEAGSARSSADTTRGKAREAGIPAGTSVREASVASSPSLSRAYLLLALGAAVALALAAGARLATRREKRR